MPIGTRPFRDSGKTVIDALAACAAITLLGCMILPALSKERDDARIAECADHLKQLGQAAHQYAADFEGKFFYHWTSEIGPDGKLVSPELIGSWHDQKRIGRYLKGQPITIQFPVDDKRPEKVIDLGLGWGPFRCPNDIVDAARSYNMNYWATTSLDPGGPERRLVEAYEDAKANRPDILINGIPIPSPMIDANVNQSDRILLFSEAFETVQSDNEWWVTAGTIGRLTLFPGERFGGSRDGQIGQVIGERGLARYGVFQLPTEIDYSRHGANKNRNLPLGAVNMAFVDGHVGYYQSSELYDYKSKFSKYQVLWSENDVVVEHANIN